MPKSIRQIRVEGNIAYVPLTKGYEAMIDTVDVPLVMGLNWYAMPKKSTVYARRNDYSGARQKTIMLHRAILGLSGGLDVDHVDGNGLNNRRANLRLATVSQNRHNQRIARNNTSGFKGVTFHKPTGKWQAQIRANGLKFYLGVFTSKESAHDAYCAASKRLHGEFGRTT